MSASAVTARPSQGRYLGVGAVTAVVVSAAVYTAVNDPYRPGMFPSCIFYSASGWHCPGCGGLRAAHELMRGDIAASLAMNPLVPLLVAPLLVVALTWWWSRAVKGLKADLNIPVWLAIAVPVALGAFWVIRNLPGMEFLRP